jgi:hypothetical protein
MIKKQHKKTSSAKEKKEGIGRDKILIISVIIIALVFFGLYSLIKSQIESMDNQPKINIKVYKDFIFEKEGNIWTTRITITNKFTGNSESYSIMFHYTPDEVEGIPTQKNSRNQSVTPNLFLNMPLVYITTEPDYPGSVVLGGVEISKVMGIVSKTYDTKMSIKSALTKPGNYSFPVITCQNITKSQRVIYLKLGNETKIDFDNGCVIVEGKNETELLRASERLAFEVLRIL